LISISTSPDCFATYGKDFAGLTVLEVPIEKKVSQAWEARLAWVSDTRGRFPPNQTTSGRNKPLQFEQRGGKVF